MKMWPPTLFLIGIASALLAEQTIEEKREALLSQNPCNASYFEESVRSINHALEQQRHRLEVAYEQASEATRRGASEEELSLILNGIRTMKQELHTMQEMWRREHLAAKDCEGYALWQEPEISLFQLVIDYGSQDYLYLLPQELHSRMVGLFSNIPIPQAAWGECLELILARYGVGVRSLNAFTKELFLISEEESIQLITDQMDLLLVAPPAARVCYVLEPPGPDIRPTLQLLNRFSSRHAVSIFPLSGKVFLVGPAHHITELLQLYSFASTHQGHQESQVLTLTKVAAGQMETILKSAFTAEGGSLEIFPLEQNSRTLFLSGTKHEVRKAIKLVQDIESQIEDPQEKTVFWYTAKHSDAEELATVLARVYDLLIGKESGASNLVKPTNKEETGKESATKAPLAVAPHAVQATTPAHHHKTADGRNNFIVDPKTGAIVMVVEQSALSKIKDLLRKLDVPKKMVQIEVLLFEKKMNHQSNIGLNLLKIGSDALNKAATGFSWGGLLGGGIAEFFTSRAQSNTLPAYDVAYQFLMSQQDVQINATPSVTTMNQTPAKIAIVEELSIDTGSGEKKEKMYSRAQYGIVMEITPTITMESTPDGELGFILLDTDIIFDTTKKNQNDRPDVTRRHIKNHVRIADGETVILGGLRRKNSDDSQESIPFLGDIPGVGKLFSCSKTNENSTEMFVFITPKIIHDPSEDMEKLVQAELMKRPGDLPETLSALLDAKKAEKRLFARNSSSLRSTQQNKKNEARGCVEYKGEA